MERLSAKFKTALNYLPEPKIDLAKVDGKKIDGKANAGSKVGVIHFGTTEPSMIEALETLANEGSHIDSLRLKSFPFHDSVKEFIDSHAQVFVVEQNRDAQMRTLLVNELEIDPARLTSITHYDGTPINATAIAAGIRERLTDATVTPIRSTGK